LVKVKGDEEEECADSFCDDDVQQESIQTLNLMELFNPFSSRFEAHGEISFGLLDLNGDICLSLKVIDKIGCQVDQVCEHLDC
jgi:hypothetical protein